jgi:predicted dinucleotide-binding enzyme
VLIYSPAVSPAANDPVAIVGASGALGFGLAVRLARADVPIAIGSRDAARACEAAERPCAPPTP